MTSRCVVLVKGRLTILVGLILVVGLAGQALGVKKEVKIETVALIPFDTFAAEALSVDITGIVTDGLARRNFNVISQDILEDFLAKRRIRRTDFLNQAVIRAMGSALDVDALVIGSADVLVDDESPRVCINAQMVDCINASVIWANSVSRTGDDYATFLGLGKITSLEKLVIIVADELLKGLPGKAEIESKSISPFEIVYAGFSPDVLRGGETTEVSVEVKEITGKVRDIKALVCDKEVPLRTTDGKWYSATITAPAVDGVYPLKINVADRWNRLFSVDAMASLTVHNNPPEIALSLRQRLLSPNDDGIKETILIVPEVLKAISLQGWKVEIVNEKGQVVRSEEGIGALPESFVWRGKDNRHEPVKDGLYFCRLIVEDEAGNRTSTAKEKVIVDATAPDVTVVLAEESEKAITLFLETEDMSQVAYWELIIHDTAGAEIARFAGEGDIPPRLTCALENNPKRGGENPFFHSLEVSDSAGNRLHVEREPLKEPGSRSSKVKTSEGKRKVWIEDF